jgi:hypothetical protein
MIRPLGSLGIMTRNITANVYRYLLTFPCGGKSANCSTIVYSTLIHSESVLPGPHAASLPIKTKIAAIREKTPLIQVKQKFCFFSSTPARISLLRISMSKRKQSHFNWRIFLHFPHFGLFEG